MAKGMSLEEFRNALSSDATLENEKLKAELDSIRKKSKRQIDELTEEVNKYKEWCRALGNRCFVFTHGAMCLNCGVESCEHAFSQDDIMEAVNYMTKNRMPRTEDTYKKVMDFLDKRRKNGLKTRIL